MKIITYYFAFPTREVYIPRQQLQWTSTSLLAITVDLNNNYPEGFVAYDIAVSYIAYELETNFGFVYYVNDIQSMKDSDIKRQWPDGIINITI